MAEFGEVALALAGVYVAYRFSRGFVHGFRDSWKEHNG